MINALVRLDENTNRVLNIVKAQYDLKDKGEAIQLVVSKYVDVTKEPSLREDFVQKMKRIEKQKSIRVKDFVQKYKDV